jgi:hypothetical protein
VVSVLLYKIEWHDVPNRAMRSGWFLAESPDEAIAAAKVDRYGCERFRLDGEPIDPESDEGRRLTPQLVVRPSRGRAAVSAKGYRL